MPNIMTGSVSKMIGNAKVEYLQETINRLCIIVADECMSPGAEDILLACVGALDQKRVDMESAVKATDNKPVTPEQLNKAVDHLQRQINSLTEMVADIQVEM